MMEMWRWNVGVVNGDVILAYKLPLCYDFPCGRNYKQHPWRTLSFVD
jgi:hypothetical protein